jgi:hypothetical protein
MEYIIEPIQQTWNVIAAMAPYLLLGFLVSAILKAYVSPNLVKNHLGRGKWTDTLKATFIGIPLPLCSCGVIPVTATIRKEGASPQATLSFLTSTPQTGVDSILATWGLMGPVFTVLRIIVAFITGFLGGIIAGPFSKKEEAEETPAPSSCCCSREKEQNETEKTTKRDFAGAFKFAFITLPGNIGKNLIIGLVIAGLLATYIPMDLFSGNLGNGILAYTLVTAVSIPLYVCSTGSIPMAFALLQAGMSPGAVLVFLVTGPATNAAAISTMTQLLGRKAIAVYLLVLTLTTWTCAWIFDAFVQNKFAQIDMTHTSMAPGIIGHLSGIALVVLLTVALWQRRINSKTKQSSCCSESKPDPVNQEEHSGKCCCHKEKNDC